MGADLYIEEVFEENHNKYKTEFEKAVAIRDKKQGAEKETAQEKVSELYGKMYEVGYFRDCYNDGGLFNFIRCNTRLQLSWWQLRDTKGWFNRDGFQNPKAVAEFLALIHEAKSQVDKKQKLVITEHNYKDKQMVQETRELKEDEVQYFKAWLQELVTFLETAVKLGYPVRWSV